jgi:hypothetical protein
MKKGKKRILLPSTIELISEKTGVVREFDTDHAFRILRLINKTGQGTYKLYNVDLYQYTDEGITYRVSRELGTPKEPEQ